MTAQPNRQRVGDLAIVRSGDKGNHANIGLIAYTEEGFNRLRSSLTCDVVADYFRDTGVTRVERFELPLIRGFNFVLYNALGGGASLSLRIDTQGKLLGTALEELVITVES